MMFDALSPRHTRRSTSNTLPRLMFCVGLFFPGKLSKQEKVKKTAGKRWKRPGRMGLGERAEQGEQQTHARSSGCMHCCAVHDAPQTNKPSLILARRVRPPARPHALSHRTRRGGPARGKTCISSKDMTRTRTPACGARGKKNIHPTHDTIPGRPKSQHGWLTAHGPTFLGVSSPWRPAAWRPS